MIKLEDKISGIKIITLKVISSDKIHNIPTLGCLIK